MNNWDVSSVTNMHSVFRDAPSSNQPIGNRDVFSVTCMNEMFSGVILSTVNYDNLLAGWAVLSLQSGV